MKIATLLLTFLLGATVALAQAGPTSAPHLTHYGGTLKNPDQGVVLILTTQGDKVSGRLESVQGSNMSLESSEGSLKDGSLSLTFGKDASLTAKVEGETIIGELLQGAKKRAFELKKSNVKVMIAEPPTPAEVAAAKELTGQWEAVADANGQPFPFLLTLKVEGEAVTGNSSSQLGEASIKEGSWKDGKLAISLENQNGVITMSATMIEGKLSGEFDYAGQLQGKWVAVKKN